MSSRSLKVMTCVVSVSGDDYMSFQCCTLDSWSTGVLLQAKNWERSMILAMKRWLLFIQQWHKNKKAFLTNINRYMIYPLANKTFYLVSLKRLVKKSTYSLSSWSLMMRSRGGLMMFEGQGRKKMKKGTNSMLWGTSTLRIAIHLSFVHQWEDLYHLLAGKLNKEALKT